jgi:protein-S-isoprenylcysteine O-methyltransferase Ste14
MLLRKAKAMPSPSQDQTQDRPRVVALPPLILAATLAASFALELVWPSAALPASGVLHFVGILLVLGSIAFAALALRAMIAAGTSPDVRKAADHLLTGGVFAYSRNPIYLGMVALCLGLALVMGSGWLLLLTIALGMVLQKGVIDREEIYLEQKFGAAYSNYKAHVRRWI